MSRELDESAWVVRGREALTLREQAVARRAEAMGWPWWHRKRRLLLREASELNEAFLEATREMVALRDSEITA